MLTAYSLKHSSQAAVEVAGSLGDKYDRVYGPYASLPQPVSVHTWPRNRNQAVVYLVQQGGRLLEVGCGDGGLLNALAPSFVEVVGSELSKARAERAQRNLAHRPNCKVLHEPLERLPEVAEGTFDCIVWTDVIEHVVDVVGAMQTLARLSRDGTQLITTTPNVAFVPIRLRLLLGRSPCTGSAACPNEGFAASPAATILYDAGHLHYFTFRQVEMLYRLAGFVPDRRMGFGRRLSRFRNMWPTLLSGTVCISGTFRGT